MIRNVNVADNSEIPRIGYGPKAGEYFNIHKFGMDRQTPTNVYLALWGSKRETESTGLFYKYFL